MNVYVIQTLLVIHMKFVDRLDEIHARIQSVASELNVIKSTVVSIVFALSALRAIHLLSAVIWTNVLIIHVVLTRYASIQLEAMIVNVNVASSEIPLLCVHPFKLMSDARIPIIVHVLILLRVQLGIDVNSVDA